MKIHFLSLLLCFSIFSIAQYNSTDVDRLLDVLDDNDQFMGSLCVRHEGKIIYERAVGFVDVEESILANTKSMYRIGSISKTFTSALIFMAVDEKKISLEDPLSKYISSFEKGEEITLSDLLNHRSGIYNFTDAADYLQWCVKPHTRPILIQRIVKGGYSFEPGSKAQYSNSNYVLLTFILEDVYEKSYADLVDQKIVKPLKLKRTKVGEAIDTKNNECLSYVYSGKWMKMAEADMSVPRGAGAITSTPEDLTSFFQQLFDGKLMSEESLGKMKEMKDNYGRGLFQFPYGSRMAYGHTGGIDAFNSMAGIFPEDDLSVALITNGTRYGNNDIMIAALAAFYGDEVKIPEFGEVEYTAEDLEKFVGAYSSKSLPLKIEVTRDQMKLWAQAEGQMAFPLKSVRQNVFSYDAAGIVMEFVPEKEAFILKQNGGTFYYTKGD
jgi:CubicO group peptidase (beta-lactamase class C family)